MGSVLEKNSSAVRKRIENHTFSDETGEEYEASAFGGFGDYFRRKKIKLQNLDAELRAAAPEKPQIFKGVVAHVMGYTQPPLHVLHKDLVQHGAGFLQYLDSKTMATHIIASALPPKKVVDYNKYRMVKPQWVVDSINARKLLSWTDYRVFDEGPRQKTIKFDGGGKMFSQVSQLSQLGYKEHTQNSFYALQLQKNAEPRESNSSPQAAFTDRASAGSPGGGAVRSSLGGLDVDYGMEIDPSPARRGIETSAHVQEDPELAQGNEADQGMDSPLPDERRRRYSDIAALAQGDQGRDPPDSHGPDPPPRATSLSRSGQKRLTSEEHNAMLLKDPKVWKSSTANPDFLRQFYSESRLHHLSTWKAELKSKMQRLAAEKGQQQRATAPAFKRKPGSRRYIMHVDFDSFFCAVSLKSAPIECAGKPAVVAHGSGTGSEIASCNYPAREFGVRNGMWMKRALELCPTIEVLPYDFPAYEEASRLFYEAILNVGGVVQSVSVDEALVDVTSLVLSASSSKGHGVDEGSVWREQEKVDELASGLRDDIKQKTGCNVSVGIGPNILLAKVALRKAKPAGQYQVKPEEILGLIGELKVEDLPGVAYSIKGKLEEVGVRLVKDVRELSRVRLTTVLGSKTGEKLWEYSRGIDNTDVGDQPQRKSVSAEVNWGVRFVSQQEAEEFVMNLCKELERRLLNEGVKGRSFTMKIMRRSLSSPLDPPKHLGHGQCDTFNKTVGFGIATHSAKFIGKEAVSVLRGFNFSPGDLRGLGVHLSKLEPIRGPTSLMPESSQKTLPFGAFLKTPSGKKAGSDPIEDDSNRRQDGKTNASSPGSGPASSGRDMSADPIADDPLTPRKPRPSPMHPALALTKAREADGQARTPLNVAGTQFLMPSQPDPEMVAALPHDIRSKLMAQQQRRQQQQPNHARARTGDESPSGAARFRTQSPALSIDEGMMTMTTGIPSQVDPEVFNALPEDVKAEVLASYGGRKGAGAGAGTGTGQMLLPQLPRKDRVINTPSKKTTPTKPRGGGGGGVGLRGMLSRTRERQHDADAGLFQTNLFPVNAAASGADREKVSPSRADKTYNHSSNNGDKDNDDGDDLDDMGELDPEILAALPEEVRREVVADHRRRQLVRRGGGLDLQVSAPPHQRRPRAGGSAGKGLEPGQTMLSFAGRPARVAFTRQSLSSVSRIKDMLHLWHRDTLDTGPHRRDVEVFERYLERVVLEERDMEKVQVLVAWLDWLVGEDDGDGDGGTGADAGADDKGRRKWQACLRGIKDRVQRAMEKRGLGSMDLGQG